MENQNEIFDLEYENSPAKVERIQIPGQTFFRVNFSNGTPPLTLLRATDANQSKFWTSIPEGRQQLAERIGLLIEHRYRSIKS